MALKLLVVALGMIAAVSPASATRHEPAPTAAPEAGPDARYCLRIEITGSRLERILCLTRQEWVDEEVDVDKEWAENGVRVIA
jgi:hypothetical protein